MYVRTVINFLPQFLKLVLLSHFFKVRWKNAEQIGTRAKTIALRSAAAF